SYLTSKPRAGFKENRRAQAAPDGLEKAMLFSAPDWLPPFYQYLLMAGGAVLAASVTADVLLTRSDVRAALGWIAAAWLAPYLGALAYFLFGINRVTRRALKLGRLA